jgi:RNA polymerase sigma-70 factor (ECF subfamily)
MASAWGNERVFLFSIAALDAFQATFLVLARKARSIAARQTVTTWLYTVAYRVALNALRERTRRQARGPVPG